MNKIMLLAMSVLLTPFSVSAAEIDFLTHSLQGQTYVDANGELRGKKHAGKRAFNLEVVREMMLIMKHPTNFREVPFGRGLLKVQQESNQAFFNVSRTAEREKTVKWVGPIQTETDYFYEMKEAPSGIKTLEDAKNVNAICVLNKNIHHQLLQKYNFNNIVHNASYVACFKMLKRGRVNLTPSAAGTVAKKLEQAGISPDQIQQTPVVLLESGGYIAFSKNTDDDTIKKWQDAFDQLKNSGRYQQLYQLYFLPEK